MSEKDRIENPLGFQVTSYRVDNDYAPSPTLEGDPDPLQPATAATAAPDRFGRNPVVTAAIAADAASLPPAPAIATGTASP
jgi:type IV secretion system protein VirB8